MDRRGRPFGRLGVDRTRRNDDIDLEPDQFLREFARPFRFSLRPPVLDGDVPTLHVAQVTKPLPKSFDGIRKHGRTIPQKTYPVDLRRLLRAHMDRPGTAEAPSRSINSRRLMHGTSL